MKTFPQENGHMRTICSNTHEAGAIEHLELDQRLKMPRSSTESLVLPLDFKDSGKEREADNFVHFCLS